MELYITETPTINLNESVNEEISYLPSVNDVQLQLTNLAYVEDKPVSRFYESGTRQLGGLVNWTANNVNVDGTKIDMWIQYQSTSGQVTHLQKILKTLSGNSGTFSFSIFSNSPYTILPNNTMQLQVFFWLRNTQTAISLNAGGQVDLQVTAPTGSAPNAPTIFIDNIETNSARLVINAPTGEPVTSYHIVVKNNSTGQTIYTLDQPNNTYNILLLQENTQYKVYVIAQNSNGNSSESQVTFTTTNVVIPPTPILNTIFRITIDGTTYDKTFIIAPDQVSIIDGHDWQDIRVAQFNVGDGTTTNPPTWTAADIIADVNLFLIDNPPINNSVDTTMISQSIGFFEIKDGRITGSVNYIANSSFNPFWYGQNISSFIQIKDYATGTPIVVKENILQFTETERDEVINIDESSGNFTKLIIEFFVWVSISDSRPFSNVKSVVIEEQTGTPQPCQAGYHRVDGICVPNDPPNPTAPDKFMGILKGMLVGSFALALVSSEMPKKNSRRL